MEQASTASIDASALGRIGIWASSLRYAPDAADGALELEQLGFKTAWVPGGIDGGVLAALVPVLDATTTLNWATGIINIWKNEPVEVASWWHGLPAKHQARLFLGLGVSHGPIIGENWNKPIAKMVSYLDGLDAEAVPRGRLCLAALGPQMLKLAAHRTAGAHPYMVTPGHTASAREIMGPQAILAPEQGVVLETDPVKARTLAREAVQLYARLPNYANSWRREGYSDTDIETLSDKLIDGLIAWGDVDTIGARVEEHFAAGADHVCLQVIGSGKMTGDLEYDRKAWRKLAKLL